MLQKRLDAVKRKDFILRDGYMPNFQMERLRNAEKAYMKLPGSAWQYKNFNNLRHALEETKKGELPTL